MKSYLSLIPISAKVRKRQNSMTLLCIVFAVFLVTAVFSMADMGVKMEQSRLLEKHGNLTLQDLLTNTMTQTLFSGSRCIVCADIDSGRIDDFQQYEQQYNPENKVFRNDALSWYEPSANNPFCETGSPELVQNRYSRRRCAWNSSHMVPVRCPAFYCR